MADYRIVTAFDEELSRELTEAEAMRQARRLADSRMECVHVVGESKSVDIYPRETEIQRARMQLCGDLALMSDILAQASLSTDDIDELRERCARAHAAGKIVSWGIPE